MKVRCLSVKEPHVTKIELGEKRIELRTWPIAPGPLAIASSGKNARLRVLVEVVECRLVTEDDDTLAACTPEDFLQWIVWCEMYGKTPYAIVLSDKRKAIHQDPIKGRLRLYSADIRLR